MVGKERSSALHLMLVKGHEIKQEHMGERFGCCRSAVVMAVGPIITAASEKQR